MCRNPQGDANVIRVPVTAMGHRYLEVQAEGDPANPRGRGERTEFQRRLAERDLEQLDDLAGDFGRSVEQFAGYRPRKEGFHDGRAPLGPAWHEQGSPTTNRLAARLETAGVQVDSNLPHVAFLDRELTPSRTTSPSDFAQPKGTVITLDLLLSAGAQPVVAEVKAGGDESAYYALIQALTACAQLAPPAQRQRLAEHYPTLGTSEPLALWIVLSEHNSRGEGKAKMLKLARVIAAGLLEHRSVSTWISEIRCVNAELPDSGPVHLQALWP